MNDIIEVRLLNPFLGFDETITVDYTLNIIAFHSLVCKAVGQTNVVMYVGATKINSDKFREKNVGFFTVEGKPFMVWYQIEVDVVVVQKNGLEEIHKVFYTLKEDKPTNWIKEGRFEFFNGEKFDPKLTRHMFKIGRDRKIRFREGFTDIQSLSSFKGRSKSLKFGPSYSSVNQNNFGDGSSGFGNNSNFGEEDDLVNFEAEEFDDGEDNFETPLKRKNFVDIEKSKVETFRLSTNQSIPDYRECTNGINMFSVCNNPNCEIHDKELAVKVGYGDHDMLKDIFKCPKCKNKVDVMNCGFINCWWKYCGRKEDGTQVQSDWNRSKKDFYSTFIHHGMKTDEEKHSVKEENMKQFCAKWSILKFQVRNPRFCVEDRSNDENLNPDMSFCSICLENVRTMKNLHETKCMHYFHRECIGEYVLSNSGKAPCPLCRAEVKIDEIKIPRRLKLKNEKHWGENESFGFGVEKIEEKQMVYRCIHVKRLCTISAGGQKQINQDWFNCKTCNLVGNHGICECCRNVCHKGHDVVISPHSVSLFRCCCGNGEGRSECKCLVNNNIPVMESALPNSDVQDEDGDSIMKESEDVVDQEDMPTIVYRKLNKYEVGNIPKLLREKKCTFTATGRNFATQRWWSCRTCSVGGRYGFCASCKDRCHNGHDVHEASNSPSSFYCDCGAGMTPIKCKCLKGSAKKRKRNEDDDEDDQERETSRRKIGD